MKYSAVHIPLCAMSIIEINLNIKIYISATNIFTPYKLCKMIAYTVGAVILNENQIYARISKQRI